VTVTENVEIERLTHGKHLPYIRGYGVALESYDTGATFGQVDMKKGGSAVYSNTDKEGSL